MDQLLLLVSIVLAFLLVSTKQGKQLVSSVSKSVSSISSQKGRVGFPTGLALLLVIFALVCLTRNRLIEGMNHGMPSPNMTVQDLCDFINDHNHGASNQASPSVPNTMNQSMDQKLDYSNCRFFPPIDRPGCFSAPSPAIWGSLNNGLPWPTGCPTIPPPTMSVVGDCMNLN